MEEREKSEGGGGSSIVKVEARDKEWRWRKGKRVKVEGVVFPARSPGGRRHGSSCHLSLTQQAQV